MAKFISQEAAIEAVKAHYPKANEMLAGIILVPAADVRPVVHGEWLPAKDGYHGHVMCSACHKIESHETDFCPNCGADMRKPNLNLTKGDNHD